MTEKSIISIWHEESGTLLAEGPKGWGITPFERNFYIRGKHLTKGIFSNTLIPGLCPYKGIYHWLNLNLPQGKVEKMLAWRYVLPNPLFPFIAFRVALPGFHPSLRYEGCW
jgi:uncharacterized protein (DUF427 family)